MVTLPHASCMLNKAIWSNLKPRCPKNIDLDHFQTELHNVNFFTQIISVQLNLPQEKARKLREVFDI